MTTRQTHGHLHRWGAGILALATAFLVPAASGQTREWTPRAIITNSTSFFFSNQVAVLVATGITSDTISSEGYEFTYTRDKLFTGGVGLTNPIGRSIRIPWPQGVEAQALTAGPAPGGAKLTIRRTNGSVFSLPALTFRLLANTGGAGASMEIMPLIKGEDAYNDPLFFDATGYYGSPFSYTTAPNHLGSTARLTNGDTYVISLYVDFALTALTLENVSITTNHPPTSLDLDPAFLPENEPADTVVGTLTTVDPDVEDTFTYAMEAGVGDTDNSAFYISGNELLTAIPFNFEVQNTYHIRIGTADQDGLSTQRMVTVQVTDVAEPAPVAAAVTQSPEGADVLQWSSLTNHHYTLLSSTDLLSSFTVVISNLPATPPLNSYTDTVGSLDLRVWQITTEP